MSKVPPKSYRRVIRTPDGKVVKVWVHRKNCACLACKRFRKIANVTARELNQILEVDKQ